MIGNDFIFKNYEENANKQINQAYQYKSNETAIKNTIQKRS